MLEMFSLADWIKIGVTAASLVFLLLFRRSIANTVNRLIAVPSERRDTEEPIQETIGRVDQKMREVMQR
jgi:hypothetical protein